MEKQIRNISNGSGINVKELYFKKLYKSERERQEEENDLHRLWADNSQKRKNK